MFVVRRTRYYIWVVSQSLVICEKKFGIYRLDVLKRAPEEVDADGKLPKARL